MNKGFEGKCLRCGKVERVYMVYAKKKIRELMSSGKFIGERRNCPACITNKNSPMPNSMKFYRKLTSAEVERDMKKHDSGIMIDFRAVDAQLRHEAQNDKWIEDNEKRIKEIVKWKKESEVGTHRYIR